MRTRPPRFVLYSEAQTAERFGAWRFVVKDADGTVSVDAADREAETAAERLELLAVVRGLEALDQPSHVSLVTRSRYVRRGIAYGLDEWRRNGWTWERFGRMVAVKNRDLWQRLDRAMRFHRIDIGGRRFDPAEPESAGPRRPFFARRTAGKNNQTSSEGSSSSPDALRQGNVPRHRTAARAG